MSKITSPENNLAIKRFKFHGSGTALFRIYFTNLILIIITFGIYYFWAKIKEKKYLYSRLEFEGDRFSFHGTGRELLIGGAFIIILVIFYSFIDILLQRFTGNNFAALLSFLLSVFILIFILFAVVLSRKYYMSRTSWRGIRFSFRGGIKNYLFMVIRGYLFSLVSLGIYFPFFIHDYKKFMVSNSYFGTRSFNYSGNGEEIFKKFISAFIVALFTALLCVAAGFIIVKILNIEYSGALKNIPIIVLLILSFFLLLLPFYWFNYRLTKYVWNNTSFLNACFDLSFSFPSFLKLKITNLILIILTIGIGWPWVVIRNSRFITDNLVLKGEIDFKEIKQEYIKASATGEAFADLLGFDFGIDFGL